VYITTRPVMCRALTSNTAPLTTFGEHDHRTVDCFTRPGSAQLVHADGAVVQKDYERVRELEW
jgi:hypothetical protein